MKHLSTALAAFWLGLQVMAGYIAAPVLFGALPKMQAGMIAGKLFDAVSYIGLAVWAAAYFLAGNRKCLRIPAAALLVLIAANQFLVTPVINAHKTHTENWLLSLTGGSFGMWHGISSLLFLMSAVSALGFIMSALRQKNGA
ncbi:DUF4149 domain-containing protein [Neisseria sp. ZJ106]|uniref:DUF4149 domain-containing protein n=1 Tax=Neisseria lisongii TaxID=2912188 RepID=A0ABY7RJZ2_9NEIS|nr:DUF4149 domain-containing protein [Neisseria lisongii]MCF7522054.1 DUF4149 domain-containing protein [Neisseria lisongii]WCL71851.1 DUF4149 domain-containing protein [Neisseria lisongii]